MWLSRRTCSTGVPAAVDGAFGKAAAAAEQLNHYHDSKSSEDPPATSNTKSSLVRQAGAIEGQGVIRAAKAAYEHRLRAVGSAAAAAVPQKVHLSLSRTVTTTTSGPSEISNEKQLVDGVESDERTEKVTEEINSSSSSGGGSNSGFGDGPEVFLGGSCNPTTWRADVAIPTLNKLGISFYNPQVSDWTPDLIELEHRAKEKARVLFFVMDSETRATAGAIEAAHIAGLNTKQLVLVLHPYKPNQKILNETVSKQ